MNGVGMATILMFLINIIKDQVARTFHFQLRMAERVRFILQGSGNADICIQCLMEEEVHPQ